MKEKEFKVNSYNGGLCESHNVVVEINDDKSLDGKESIDKNWESQEKLAKAINESKKNPIPKAIGDYTDLNEEDGFDAKDTSPDEIRKANAKENLRNGFTGVELISKERFHQKSDLGFHSNDECITKGELVSAAMYALTQNAKFYPVNWDTWWKDKIAHKKEILSEDEFKVEILTQAGALIAAEIDRIKYDDYHKKYIVLYSDDKEIIIETPKQQMPINISQANELYKLLGDILNEGKPGYSDDTTNEE